MTDLHQLTVVGVSSADGGVIAGPVFYEMVRPDMIRRVSWVRMPVACIFAGPTCRVELDGAAVIYVQAASLPNGLVPMSGDR